MGASSSGVAAILRLVAAVLAVVAVAAAAGALDRPDAGMGDSALDDGDRRMGIDAGITKEPDAGVATEEASAAWRPGLVLALLPAAAWWGDGARLVLPLGLRAAATPAAVGAAAGDRVGDKPGAAGAGTGASKYDRRCGRPP